MCGLGMKVLTPACTLALSAQRFAPFGQHALAQVGDGLHIFERLGGMADHEVELDVRPAARIDFAGGLEQLLVGDELVDDAPHPFGGRLGRQREPARAPVFEFFHQVHRNRVDPQRRQRDGQVPAAEFFADLVDQFEDIGVIGGGQRKQRQFFGSGGIDGLLRPPGRFRPRCVRAPGA